MIIVKLIISLILIGIALKAIGVIRFLYAIKKTHTKDEFFFGLKDLLKSIDENYSSNTFPEEFLKYNLDIRYNLDSFKENESEINIEKLIINLEIQIRRNEIIKDEANNLLSIKDKFLLKGVNISEIIPSVEKIKNIADSNILSLLEIKRLVENDKELQEYCCIGLAIHDNSQSLIGAEKKELDFNFNDGEIILTNYREPYISIIKCTNDSKRYLIEEGG